jgi:hypothetical protein
LSSTVVERDSAISECNSVSAERDAVAAERDSLKITVDTLFDEHDTARADSEVLQDQVNQLNSNFSAIENERDDLKQEVNTLVIECDEARAESDSVRTRIRVVGHQQSNDGSRIYFSRYVVNTTIDTVDYAFHVTGYDMTGDPVVNLYVGNSPVSSGYYNAYGHIVNYAALVISSYYVHKEW